MNRKHHHPGKIPEAERQQVRARKAAGHDFALKQDEFGRERLIEGTAEAGRDLELTTGGYVRVRTADPLKGISSLTAQQRQAGEQYRADFEAMIAAQHIDSGWLREYVDGGKATDMSVTIHLMAIEAHQRALKAIGHPDIVEIVNAVCGASFAISEYARVKGESREAVVRLLKIGLDNLVDHYGISSRRKRV